MKKIAIILSGCGVFDGSEIHESVLTLLHVELNGGQYQCFAPDIQQHHVIDHFKQQPSDESRNVLVESARIARGDIQDLAQLNVDQFDALILPGGFGAAKNLTNFAEQGAQSYVLDQVLHICKAFADANKPVGYACIAPVIIPRVYPAGVKLTIGNDADTAKAINEMGGQHVNCNVDQVVVDERYQVVSTPAYMLAENIAQANRSIGKLVEQVMALTN
ncbi:isoprenoid biosynthesis glyoxalase ElbB [Thalassotalea ponticola]|uniref:isoprenoid biosynthesis glyoxalase ElbB n=1 Tax=Thalassotalea ponticola TaxID=1523392 RepID=UPI0025B515EE|nr:isoprenoid biosynthesis glyoxalase ElbB [Thalassotalea ponticola]MDN3651862.1 isoprenoid biosynthesis glyoxalase ElbB [Thalassotalea ponticola]